MLVNFGVEERKADEPYGMEGSRVARASGTCNASQRFRGHLGVRNARALFILVEMASSSFRYLKSKDLKALRSRHRAGDRSGSCLGVSGGLRRYSDPRSTWGMTSARIGSSELTSRATSNPIVEASSEPAYLVKAR